ncbi:MAG: IS66 family insertion sequence element accessory protein TnpB [Oceanospirillaceae bacterium]
MKSLSEFQQVHLHRDFVDFRKSINGLSVIVEQEMNLSPYGAGLFVFCNKGGDKLKLLYWDSTGFCLCYKRLEKDKLQWPKKHSEAIINLDNEHMSWLLRGFDINRMKPHKTQQYTLLS